MPTPWLLPGGRGATGTQVIHNLAVNEEVMSLDGVEREWLMLIHMIVVSNSYMTGVTIA
jgi:hypothetical protein